MALKSTKKKYWPEPPKEKIAASISAGLRADLIRACGVSGRSMTQEIEARLRIGLDSPASDQIVLLRIDGGLWAYMTALRDSGVNLWGTLEAQAIFAIRKFIQEQWENDPFAQAMYRHLPQHIQDAYADHPRFQKRSMPLFGETPK